MAVSADGKTVFTVTPVLGSRGDQKLIAKFVIRRVAEGRVVHEGSVNAPGSARWSPVVLGDTLLIPTCRRIRPPAPAGHADRTRIRSPPVRSWVGDRRTADAVCYITPLSDTTFLTSDGGQEADEVGLAASGAVDARRTGRGNCANDPPGPAVRLAADARRRPAAVPARCRCDGSVWLFAADRAGQPLRRWRPGGGQFPRASRLRRSSCRPDAARTDCSWRTRSRIGRSSASIRNATPPLWAVRTGEDADATLVGAPQRPAGRWGDGS